MTQRDRALGAGAAVGLHALVLAVLGWRLAPPLAPRGNDAPALALTLVRAVVAPAASSAKAEAQPAAFPLPATASSASPKRQAPLAASPTTPSAAPTAGGAIAEGADAGSAAVLGALRALLGCDPIRVSQLAAQERARCEARLVLAARMAPRVNAIPAEKRAYYDKVVAAYAKMSAPTPQIVTHPGDNLGLEERWAGPRGAHLPSFGCGLPLGPPPRGWKSYHDKPPHSLKLGRLPCFLVPPSGFATEEADVQDPASLRERTEDDAHAAQFDAPRR